MNSVGTASLKTVLRIKENCGIQYVFMIPAIAILSSAIIAAIFMPETHGLTLKEIGELYSTEQVNLRILHLY